MRQDWHSKADEKLYELRDNHNTITYQAMIAYFEALYEREKENMALSTDPMDVNRHWIAAIGIRTVLDDLAVTSD